MWISRKKYKTLKQERNFALNEKGAYKELYDSLKKDYAILQLKYNKLREDTLKLFEVIIYLDVAKPIVYNVKAFSSEEAKEYAIKIFIDKNKDFSASDIVMTTVKPMNCAK